MARKSYKNLDFNKIKSKLVKFRANVAGIVYNGLVHETPRRKIMINLLNQARASSSECGFGAKEYEELYKTAYRTYVKCLNKANKGLLEAKKDRKGVSYYKYLKSRSKVVYEQINDIFFSDEEVLHDVNSIVAQKEKEFRINQLQNLFNQPSDSYTPFFLCSSHINPAEDHAPYQGKMYYDAEFASKVADQTTLNKVSTYIRNHKLTSIQEIMGPPVYLCTRRNCKHYFVPIPIERVLGSSVNSMLKSYHMIRQEPESISPARRAKNTYKNRYAIRREMWKIMPNEELAKDMSKDRKLINKWSKIIDEG